MAVLKDEAAEIRSCSEDVRITAAAPMRFVVRRLSWSDVERIVNVATAQPNGSGSCIRDRDCSAEGKEGGQHHAQDERCREAPDQS